MECFANPDAVATDGQIAFFMFVATSVGAAFQWLVAKGFDWWRERRGERAAGQATIVNHLQALVTRLDAEKEELARQKEEESEGRRKESEKNSRCKISASGMKRHIRYLELTLTRAKIVFVPYEEEVDPDGSDVHTPLEKLPDEPKEPPPEFPPVLGELEKSVTAALLVLVVLLGVLVVVAAVVLYRVERLLTRVEKLLTLNERHGTITDDKVQEIRQNTLAAAQAVVGAIKGATKEIKAEVPPRVVEQIARSGPDSHGDSGTVRTVD